MPDITPLIVIENDTGSSMVVVEAGALPLCENGAAWAVEAAGDGAFALRGASACIAPLSRSELTRLQAASHVFIGQMDQGVIAVAREVQLG